MTCSLGIGTVIPGETMTPKELIAIADHGLYQAKAEGRNQSVVSSFCDTVLPKK
jgi:PleD family two-component response regulator